jgi:hypothetical protein
MSTVDVIWDSPDKEYIENIYTECSNFRKVIFDSDNNSEVFALTKKDFENIKKSEVFLQMNKNSWKIVKYSKEFLKDAYDIELVEDNNKTIDYLLYVDHNIYNAGKQAYLDAENKGSD